MVLFLVAGVPDDYSDRLQARFSRELRDHRLAFLPLRQEAGGYRLTGAYFEDILETLAKYIVGRPQVLSDALAVIVVVQGQSREAIREFFYPFALLRQVEWHGHFPTGGAAGRQAGNRITSEVIHAARRLTKPGRALKNEMQERLKRTPLLLPVRHFEAAELNALIETVHDRTAAGASPNEAIQDPCAQFERAFPYRPARGSKAGFTNGKGTFFGSPGRDLHGLVRDAMEASGNHKRTCALNGFWRLGAPIAEGFHYDCTNGKGAYRGEFSNCHGEVEKWVGKPHLNVYPNDFIRD